jgi:hypothetical protein
MMMKAIHRHMNDWTSGLGGRFAQFTGERGLPRRCDTVDGDPYRVAQIVGAQQRRDPSDHFGSLRHHGGQN